LTAGGRDVEQSMAYWSATSDVPSGLTLTAGGKDAE
jgi:hypothetical protein